MVSHRGSMPCGREGVFAEVGASAFCAGEEEERQRREKRGRVEQGNRLLSADRGIMAGDGS